MNPERAVALNAGVTTARLVVEPLTADHAREMFVPLQDPQVYEWISVPPPRDLALLEARWTQRESRLSPTGETAWLNWVVRRKADGACLGKIDAEVTDQGLATYVGYLFFPAHWGHGYATESVGAVVQHLASVDVTEVRATVTVGNTASMRVLEKIGFTRTGVLHHNDTLRGVPVDDVAFVRALETSAGR